MSRIKCHRCGIVKVPADFYEKTDKATGKIRRDRTCGQCRREQRNSRYKANGSDASTSKRIIEPRKDLSEPRNRMKVATTRDANKMDFTDMEAFYGKSISTLEKVEAIQRFNDFVGMLREGYSELVREDVFIRKD